MVGTNLKAKMKRMTNKMTDIDNLFLAKSLEDIDSEGRLELVNGRIVWAKNLLEIDIKKNKNVLLIKDKKTGKYYISTLNVE
jgi:hypothetical protein